MKQIYLTFSVQDLLELNVYQEELKNNFCENYGPALKYLKKSYTF